MHKVAILRVDAQLPHSLLVGSSLSF